MKVGASQRCLEASFVKKGLCGGGGGRGARTGARSAGRTVRMPLPPPPPAPPAGEWQNGVRHGRGTCLFASSDKYQGARLQRVVMRRQLAHVSDTLAPLAALPAAPAVI